MKLFSSLSRYLDIVFIVIRVTSRFFKNTVLHDFYKQKWNVFKIYRQNKSCNCHIYTLICLLNYLCPPFMWTLDWISWKRCPSFMSKGKTGRESWSRLLPVIKLLIWLAKGHPFALSRRQLCLIKLKKKPSYYRCWGCSYKCWILIKFC